jgi:hypothetical protein
LKRLRISGGALAELVIVTAGVLIALSVDTVREWRANDRLAAEARANILNEIRANKERLDQLRRMTATHVKERVALRARVANVLAGKPMGAEPPNLNYTLPGLSASAFQTAEITGAFRYLDYDEVRGYSGLYDLQARYVRIVDEMVETTGLIVAPLMFTAGDELSRPELESLQRELQQAFAQLNLQTQFAALLSRAYDDALKRAESGGSDQ